MLKFSCLLGCVCVLFLNQVSAQTHKVYKNLAAALLQPDSVFHLDLSKQKLKYIPSELILFKKLQTLSLANNKITNLDFIKLPFNNLVKIDVSGNKIAVISSQKNSVTKLTYLNISYNQLAYLPEELNEITGIDTLICNGNKLFELPNWVMSNEKKIQYLNVAQNRLVSLPPVLNGNKDLKFIDLSQNDVVLLPESWANLSALETLNLSQNYYLETENIARTLGDMKNLQNLTLRNCNISGLYSLTRALVFCRQLQRVDLFANPLTELQVNQMRGLLNAQIFF